MAVALLLAEQLLIQQGRYIMPCSVSSHPPSCIHTHRFLKCTCHTEATHATLPPLMREASSAGVYVLFVRGLQRAFTLRT